MNPYEHLLLEQSRIKKKKSIFDRQQTTLMLTRWIASNDSTEGQIYPSQCIHFNERYIKNKFQSKSVLGFNSSEGITNFNNHDISYSNMRCEVCIKQLWDYMSRKIDLLKELHILVKALNKNFKVPGEKNMEFVKNS